MSVTIQSTPLKFKDSNGEYIGVNAVTDRTTAEQLSIINTRAAEVQASLPTSGEMEAMVAVPFVQATAYPAGQYVIQTIEGVNKLFRLPEGHTANTTWGATTKEGPLTVGGELDAISKDAIDLKSAISDITGNTEITNWSENKKYIKLDGSTATVNTPTTTTSNVHYAVVSASEGDKFTITATGGNASRAYGFVASNGTILEKAAASATLNMVIVTAPADTAYLVINDTTLTGKSYYGILNSEKQKWLFDDFARQNEYLTLKQTNSYTWSKGTIDTSDGTSGNSTTRIRTALLDPIEKVSIATGYKIQIFVYNSSSVYQGVLSENGFVKKAVWQTGAVSMLSIPLNYKVRYLIAKADDSSIETSDGSNMSVFVFTDTELTNEGKSADAKAVGDLISTINGKIRDETIAYRGSIATTTDFDSVTDCGTYTFTNSSATDKHRPFSQQGNLLVMPTKNASRLTQIAIGVDGIVLYVRARVSDTWSEWKRFLNSDDDTNIMKYRQSYITAVDFDTLTGMGTYQMARTSYSAAYHRPTLNPCVLIVTGPNTSNLSQICIDVEENTMYYRSRTNATWTNWTASNSGYTHDVPENIGIYNIIRRAYQLSKIKYTPVAVLPGLTGDMDAGTEYTGIPYSSTRVEQNYVPNAISLDTFMTAMQNENSYLYTRVSTAHNSKTYYGAVCSTFVAYCYGIDDVIPTTISFSNYPGFVQLNENEQNPQGLHLGDMLNDAGSHIVIVTDIIRDERGTVKTIEVSEAYMPRCRSRKLSADDIQDDYFDSGYVAYRYEYANLITYTPSQWVSVFSDEQTEPEWNHNIMPRRGDKANWRISEDIVFDIDNDEEYTQYIVINRETNTQAYSGSVSDVITLENVPAGKYKIYLTDGTNNSDDAFFTMQNPSITYIADGNGNVVVSWVNDNYGEAASILWVNNNVGGTDYNAVRDFHILTDAEKTACFATVTPPNMSSSEAPDGVWGIRMMFKTEFGLFASDIYHIQIT